MFWAITSAYLPHSLPPLPLQPRDIRLLHAYLPRSRLSKTPKTTPQQVSSACHGKSLLVFSSCDPTRRINSVFVRPSPTFDKTPKHSLLDSSSLLPIYLKRHLGSRR